MLLFQRHFRKGGGHKKRADFLPFFIVEVSVVSPYITNI